MKIKNKQGNLLYGDITRQIIKCVYEVCNTYGSGYKEKLYQKALLEKLRKEGLSCQSEVGINICSENSGQILENHRLDLVIEDKVVVECKALKFVPQKLENQLYSYLKNSKWEVGLLINFGSTNLYLKRVILTNERKSRVI